MFDPNPCLVFVHLLATAVVLAVGHVVLVVIPAHGHSLCLTPARFTVWGMTAGHAALPCLACFPDVLNSIPLLPCGCGYLLGAAVGGTVGFVVGQAARVAMLRQEPHGSRPTKAGG